MTMLQLGAIKKIRRDFFFPSSYPSKDGERKGLWQEIYSRSENDDSDFPSEDLEEPTYQSIFMILENCIHNEARILLKTLVCIYILYRSVWKRMPRASRLM